MIPPKSPPIFPYLYTLSKTKIFCANNRSVQVSPYEYFSRSQGLNPRRGIGYHTLTTQIPGVKLMKIQTTLDKKFLNATYISANLVPNI